jgi:acyl transferase domain-containing protein
VQVREEVAAANTQPALFAVEVALAQTLLAWGTRPACLLGHSVAAINGPERTVLSGRRDHLDTLAQAFAAAGVATRFLEVSQAFHSPLLAPIADAFGEVASAIHLRAPQMALVSNVTGARIAEEIATPQYWVRHLLEPVRFGTGVQALFADGSTAPGVVIEVGPGAALLAMAREALPSERAEIVAWLPTLRRGVRDDVCLTRTLGQLFLQNVPVDWSAVLGGRPRGRRVLPGYPFDRERHWRRGGGGQRLARHGRSGCDPGARAPAAGPGRLAGHARGHPAPALAGLDLWSHRWLVALL